MGPGDHVAGYGEELVLYVDFSCPACAVLWADARAGGWRLCVRHFPMPSRRPRAPAVHAAVEAAAVQGAFWEFSDSVFGDHGRLDDPHLWARVRDLGLELERFEADRRSPEVAERVARDFNGGIRAGVAGTPTAFREGVQVPLATIPR